MAFPPNAPSANPVFYRTYSRNTVTGRENWQEVVNRTVEGLARLGQLTPDEIELIRQFQENLITLTSGRWLWVGGTTWIEQPENYPGGYNCLAGETLVTTLEYGAVPVVEIVGQLVHVLNANRQWVTVKFQSYGVQSIFEVTLRRGVASGATRTIRCTPDHEWILVDGERRTTEDLENYYGDCGSPAYLKFLTAPRPTTDSATYGLGVQHGIVYGDGSVQGSGTTARKNFKVRLCGSKAHLLSFFPERSRSYPPSCKGDPIVYVPHKQFLGFVPDGNLKQLPITTDTSYLLGFVRGLMATDGCVSGATPIITVSGHLETLLWLEKTAPLLGIETGTLRCMYRAGDRSNLGVRRNSTYGLSIYVGSVDADDFLRPEHKQALRQGLSLPSDWRVLQVEDLDETAEVFCCEEHETHSFVLTGGLLTGNCSSSEVVDWRAFGLIMELAMMGCGTGAMLEPRYINNLPPIRTKINLTIAAETGLVPKHERLQETRISGNPVHILIEVGDSRQGWVGAYMALLEIAAGSFGDGQVDVHISLANVRPPGEKIQGFGGVANPEKLPQTYQQVVKILNRALDRQLNAVECCLLIDEAAVAIVAGNVRRSAGMRQFASFDELAAAAKDNLWQMDGNGGWSIDPERDALRMANHTLVYHVKPTLEAVTAAVRKQYFSGEGAIQYAPEAIARSNADLLNTEDRKSLFLKAYLSGGDVRGYLENLAYKDKVLLDQGEIEHRLRRYGLNPCGEILGSNFFCNLSEIHLNQIDPEDFGKQTQAFEAGALSAAVLLHHKFVEERYRQSREWDPIIGVSFTGLFDFFVQAFGLDWLKWWQAGRPQEWGEDMVYRPFAEILTGAPFSQSTADIMPASQFFRLREQDYLNYWRWIVEETVKDYCNRANLRIPNRCTTVQPAGCGSRELLRIFDQGLIYADEIMEDGQGEVEGIPLTVRGGIAASTGIANQPLQLVRVTLQNGRILRLTPNHRLSVEGEWVCAEELLPGMAIDSMVGGYQCLTEQPLLSINLEGYRKYNESLAVGQYQKGYLVNITTPAKTSQDLGYFIGAMFGNGCCGVQNGTKRVRFCHGNPEILEKISKVAFALFGITGTFSTESHRGELSLASNALYDWLVLNGLAKTEKSKDLDRIPLVLRKASKNTLLGFFCGLIDTDGCVREAGSLSIDSASEKFIRNLQQIGEAIGLSFAVSHNTQGSNFQGTKSIWSLILSRMTSLPSALEFLNTNSMKCAARPISLPRRTFKFTPYAVQSVEWEQEPDYSFDFAISGVDDDDSWYWQGALKSHNTKSLLSGASPGWHPPKAAWFIRRITFRRDDPVALACIDYGYSVIPSQSCKDEVGNLLNDPYDPRVTEWLIEIPTAVPWAEIPGVDQIDISQFSAVAQFDFYMQVQRHYTRHNCFSRDTEFLTSDGIKSFNDFSPGDTVTVLNGNGDWVPATVVCTDDLREMVEITLTQGKTGKQKKILATQCHRFPVRRSSAGASIVKIVTAADLKVGHRMLQNFSDLPSLEPSAICHGIVWGDGSAYKNSKGEYVASQVYLCAGKRELASYFGNFDRCRERDDLDQTRIYGLPLDWKKTLPPEHCSQSYLAGFIAGLLATDGNISGSVISISTGQQRLIDFLERQCPRLGIIVSGKYLQKTSENSYAGDDCYQIRFTKASFPENMILRSFHQEHFYSKQSQPCQWRVTSISQAPEPMTGWCVMEPITNQFTLTDNILTFNTSATIEMRENDIEPLANAIFDAIDKDRGYISSALLARFDDYQSFPRMPFEPIDQATYDRLSQEVLGRRTVADFQEALSHHLTGTTPQADGPAPCDSDKCLIGGTPQKP